MGILKRIWKFYFHFYANIFGEKVEKLLLICVLYVGYPVNLGNGMFHTD